MARSFDVRHLGRAPYGEVHELQKALVEARARGEIGDTILVVEHARVVTLGRGTKPGHVLLTPEMLATMGFEVHETGRGGDVTYHGPGQLVIYPIIDLKPDRCDVRKYVKDLEETMLRTCADYGVTATRDPDHIGVWVGQNKIGAIGVRISRWVTMHGLALNVSTDLRDFDVIVPCGIAGRGVTSLERELARSVALADVAERALLHLASLYDADLRSASISSTNRTISSSLV